MKIQYEYESLFCSGWTAYIWKMQWSTDKIRITKEKGEKGIKVKRKKKKRIRRGPLGSVKGRIAW